ncbi:MAG: GNAT family N-acetyltransferase [Paraclostridium sp.]
MNLIDITKDNWLKIIFLTTNKEDMPTLCEEYIASNALSIVQAKYEESWITKAIENDGEIIGFTMYGYCKEHNFFELCRIMIDKKHQGNGYGTRAIKSVLEEMRNIEGCEEVYLSTDSENIKGKYIYEKIGFKNTGNKIEDEDLYCYKFS